MAIQYLVDEIKDKQTYLNWLQKKSGFDGVLSMILFEADFSSSVDEDKIQMNKAKELRKVYSQEVGSTRREKDRLWKSIFNECSMLEMLVYLASSMNEMLNESEEDQTPEFFHVLLENGEFLGMDDEDWDFQHEAALRYWKNRIRMITDRTYSEDGKGGLFPLREYSEDQRKVPIWYQFNAWLEENSDEDGQFLWKTERLSGAK